MGRAKSDFLKAFGMTFEILKALVNEVMSLGGTDDDVRQILTDATLRSEIARLIVASGSAKPASSWVLDWHPAQKHGGTVKSHELRKYYDGPQFAGRHLSLESPLVRGWRANPETYPEGLKSVRVYLWGSTRHIGHARVRVVSCIFYTKEGKVTAAMDDISLLDGSNPVLLAGTPVF